MKKTVSLKSGFTLLEILLVVGIISILAGIVILAINPTKQLGDTRNAQRRSDVLTIINAIYQYALDGNDLDDLGLVEEECTTSSTIDAMDLSTDLVGTSATSSYLTAIPTDPIDSNDNDFADSEYFISKNSSGRVTVCAPAAENGITIEVTR